MKNKKGLYAVAMLVLAVISLAIDICDIKRAINSLTQGSDNDG